MSALKIDTTRKIAHLSAAAAVSLALCLTSGCSRDPNVRKQKYLESGKRYEASEKYREATIQFSNALKVDKNFADAHYELAKTYLKMGSAMQGYTELLRTVDLAPGNQAARIDLGNLLLAGRAADRAAEQANAVLAINPKNADAYALLSGVEQRRGNIDAALKDIHQALALDPNKASYHTTLALFERTNPSDEGSAETELQKAASLDPKSATPHLVLADLLERKHDLGGAEREYKAAIAAAPKNLQARGLLAALYYKAGDKDKTEQTLRQAVVDEPENQEATNLLVEYYVRTQQVDRAEATFAELTGKYPKSFPIKLTYARLLADKKEFDKASAIAAELTKSDGGNVDVQVLNSTLMMNTGKVNDAYELLKKATKDNPNNLQTQLLLARVCLVKGDTALAESSYRAAAKLSPGNMDAASGLAQMAMSHNDAGALQEIGEQTIKLHADSPQGYLWRGMAEANRKEYAQAESDFQTVLKKSPDSGQAYLDLGELRLAQGKVADGRAMLEKAIEKDPNAMRALDLLIAFDFKDKQPAKALDLVKAQIARSPNNGLLYNDLAQVQLQMRDAKGAQDSAAKAMQLAPGSFEIARTYTNADMALGQVDPAIALWDNWLKAHPSDARAMAMMGLLEDAKGDKAKAEEYYKKTLAADPNDGTAANNLAYLMVENGENTDVALSLAQTARRNMPNSPQTADTLAWIYYYKGNYLSARDLLEEALKTDPNNASMHYHLGMIYSKMNDKPDAQLHLKKAVSIAPDGKAGKAAQEELSRL